MWLKEEHFTLNTQMSENLSLLPVWHDSKLISLEKRDWKNEISTGMRSSQIPSQGSVALRETIVYVMAYSVLTATYSITWNTLNLTDTLLSSQACIFYQGMHSQKCLRDNLTKSSE